MKFLGHVLRLRDDEPVKEYALYVPPHGSISQEGHAHYLKYVQHLLGDSDGMLQPNNISSLAQDHSGCGYLLRSRMMMMMNKVNDATWIIRCVLGLWAMASEHCTIIP